MSDGRRRAISGLLVASIIPLLAGCGNGDFGEIRPSLARDNIHDWVAADATGSIPSSTLQLTDDERQLRDLVYPLVEPPYLRHTAGSYLREYGSFPASITPATTRQPTRPIWCRFRAARRPRATRG